MRLALSCLALTLCLAGSAHAALVWSETTNRGVPTIMWARGANLNEAHAAAKAMTNQPIRVLQTCRQPGFYAYVGSQAQSQHGIACGYETAQSAVLAAHQACELEDGLCDLEKIGYDDGEAVANNADAAGLPQSLGNSSANGNNSYPSSPELNPRIMLNPFK